MMVEERSIISPCQTFGDIEANTDKYVVDSVTSVGSGRCVYSLPPSMFDRSAKSKCRVDSL